MMRPAFREYLSQRELPLILLLAFLVCLFMAGGASRADVSAQLVIRSLAWIFLAAAIIFAPNVSVARVRVPMFLLIAIMFAVGIQLLPLPPGLWLALPGRNELAGAATATGQPQPWRPLSLSPGATVNSLSSLIVPLLVLVLASQISLQRHRILLTALIVLVATSCIWAVGQFLDVMSPNPLMNHMPGQVGGPFANRNHLALLLSIGLLVLPVWYCQRDRPSVLRLVVAAGLTVVATMVILAIGSRAGLVLGLTGAAGGVGITFKALHTRTRAASRFRRRVLVFGGLTAISAVALASLAFDRSAALERAMALDVGADLRARAVPTVVAMIGQYFPVGSGFGTFDPVFRISEPDDLLSPSYLNHAHNDFLEIALDGGILGIALLVAGLGWWLVQSVRVWRGEGRDKTRLRRTGSAIILLVLLASIVDYPARTPLIMALLALAAVWLQGDLEASGRNPADGVA